jgi:Tfp pilus assembly protein PilF
MSSKQKRTLAAILVVVALTAGAAGYVLWRQNRLPAPGSPEYEQYVDAFQIGVAALDADVPQMAEESLTEAVGTIPEEPAGWADRAIVYLRSNRLKEAAHDLNEAVRLAPDSPSVQNLIGLLEQRRGRFGEAAAWLQRAIDHEPQDVRALYLLTQVVEQEHKEGSEAQHQQLLERILELRPDNLRVLTDHLRLVVRRSDEKAVRESLARLKKLSPGWSKQAQNELRGVEQKLPTRLGPKGVSLVLGLSHLLEAEPGFIRHAREVSPGDELVGDPLQTFLRLAPVRPAPAAPDTDLKFASEPLPDAPAGAWQHAVPIWLTGKGEPETFLINDAEIRRAGSELALSTRLKAATVTPIDWNNDLRTDLAVSGEGGIRFYQQQEDGRFDDVAGQTALGDDVLQADYDGALAADVDLDGDLDLILARSNDCPLFLRNNFDGTFTPAPIFEDVNGAQRFAWGDFDHDGAPDAALLDKSGKLNVFANERSANFVPWPVAPPQSGWLAMSAADANDDGVFDIVAINREGRLSCISDVDQRRAWDERQLALWPKLEGDRQATVDRLITGDFDNNGAVDLLASGEDISGIWLKDAGGKFQELSSELPPRVQAAADLRGQGRLDLLALDSTGKPVRLSNSGKKTYHWLKVRPEATRDKADGDKRINSFGIGGEIEVRTGTQVVKQAITAPVVHFGLGERKRADVTRIVWPNGTFQAEFKTPVDQAVLAVQRLKGSCPFLFAFDGERTVFVTDFMWSTPLGMFINASDKGGFLQTTDWVKIPGRMLARRDDKYELRVNANLWETHFFDHLSLLVVDHPADTEMLVDERFFMEPTEPGFHLTEPPRTVAAARDHLGQDAWQEISAVDGVYLDRCGRGVYQGLTQDHWVEVDLGPDAPEAGPLWLVARGWVHPTDSSINYALGQGQHDAPRALALEVPDGQGGWKVARDRLGFPAGKNKTMLIRLDGLAGSTRVPRHFRLRTNMEIYWDWIAYARPRDDAPCERRQLSPATADLRFRGILAMTQANRSSPELPDYDRIVARGRHWRDLTGYHTRHGDIRELLESADDRYAIVTAGDEIVLEFTAPPDPQPGWKRDFVWVADGWVKDGDFNTRFGKTVLPLPAHDMNDYTTAPGQLEDDPVYRRHRADWETYHTRYVTPYAFERGLRGFRASDTDGLRGH